MKPYTTASRKGCSRTIKYKNMSFVFILQLFKVSPENRSAPSLKEKLRCAVQRPKVP